MLYDDASMGEEGQRQSDPTTDIILDICLDFLLHFCT